MSLENWVPKTELGKDVMKGKYISIDEIFAEGRKIKESEIVDKLLPNIQSEIVFIGGSPGKGGGIKRTPTRRTTRMHRSGRKYSIKAMVIVGNGDGYVGIGNARSQEHHSAIEKAIENAKINLIPVKRGCGSWECACGEEHSIPMKIEGKAGSLRVRMMPAPKGIGLCIHDEGKKLMKLSGVKDIWSKSFGATRTRMNYVVATIDAFKKINKTKLESHKMQKRKKTEVGVEDVDSD